MTQSPVKVSIIIPVYNSEKWLRAALESVVAQSYASLEIICINDGSTDGSVDILEEFATRDNRFKILHQVNQGQSAARNRGIDIASGEFVAFLDSDDILWEKAIETLLSLALDNKAEMASGAYSRHWPLRQPAKATVVTLDSYQATLKTMFQHKGYDNSLWGKIMSRSLFDDGLCLREGFYYEDLDLFYRLQLRCRRIAYTNAIVYYYRDTPNSFINSVNRKRLDTLKVTRWMEEFVKQNHPSLAPAARDRRLSANFNIFGLVGAHRDRFEDSAQIMDECYYIIRRYRFESLWSRHTRIKNRLGVLLSLLPKRVFLKVISQFYR